MKAMKLGTGWHRAGAAAVGVGALLVAVGCGTRDLSGVSAQSIAANQAGVPVIVSCEPHQRTLVRPVVVNGAMVSQVECVASGQVPAAQLAAPEQPQPVYRTVRAPQPVYADFEDARVVPAAQPVQTARPTQTRQVVYEREPVKQGRSVKKSAIIIGSSAGVGAGVGAMVGGKKGALIGAAIGGGGATIWDQVTRRK
jgi:uncharacterized protein YcfJ